MAVQFDEVEAPLRALTCSTIRSKIILSLLEGPREISELSDQIGSSVTTLLHSIKPLQKEGTIGPGPLYELTHTGHIKAMALNELLKVLAVVSQNEQFWQTHDISGIPPGLLTRIGELVGSLYVHEEQDRPLNCQTFFIEEVSKAKHVWGISPIIIPGYVEMVTTLLDGGASVRLILTRRVISNINPKTIEYWFTKDFRLHEISNDVTVAFTITDNMLSLGLCNLDGSYDFMRDLDCFEQRAVEWGMELWEYYLKKAKKV